MKKVTLKDIAREAGVSTATVSYVLNKVKNQTLSDETRQLVMETAKRLNYVPNLAARSLVKRQSGLIGIFVMEHGGVPWKELRYSRFIHRMEALCREQGQHVIVSSMDPENLRLDLIVERELDGVFILDADEAGFYEVAHHFTIGVPIIVIDSIIDDELFHKVIPNVGAALDQAVGMLGVRPAFMVVEDFHSRQMLQAIMGSGGLPQADVHIMSAPGELETFMSHYAGRPGVVVGELAAQFVLHHTEASLLSVVGLHGMEFMLPPGCRVVTAGELKAETAWELMRSHLSGHDFTGADKTVYVPIQTP